MNAALYQVENHGPVRGKSLRSVRLGQTRSRPQPVLRPAEAEPAIPYNDAVKKVDAAASEAQKSAKAARAAQEKAQRIAAPIQSKLDDMLSAQRVIMDVHVYGEFAKIGSSLKTVLYGENKRGPPTALRKPRAMWPDTNVRLRRSKLKKALKKPPAADNDDVPLGRLVTEAQQDAADAEKQKLQAEALEATLADNASALNSLHTDPPVDSLLHSVQFVVTYGGGVSPSWTLLQLKGPGSATSPAASATGQRTHLLSIALGPAASTEQNRLIQNQILNALSH